MELASACRKTNTETAPRQEPHVVFDVGNFNFAAAANYALKFTVTGKNGASTGDSISFDDFTLTPQ